MCDYDSCEGFLKQQCKDSGGLYEWTTKYFKLLINEGIIEIRDSHGIQTSVSIFGAKYGKEWSYSSSLSGFGFDLVWGTGNIWSFLVEDEDTCKKWVHCLNYSIMLLNSLLNDKIEDVTAGATAANISTSNHQAEVSMSIRALKPPFHISDSIDNLRAAVSSESYRSANIDRSYRYNTATEYDEEDHSQASSVPQPISSEFLTQNHFESPVDPLRHSSSGISHHHHHSQLHHLQQQQQHGVFHNISAIPLEGSDLGSQHSSDGVSSTASDGPSLSGQHHPADTATAAVAAAVADGSHGGADAGDKQPTLRDGGSPDPLPDMLLHASRMLNDYKLQLSSITGLGGGLDYIHNPLATTSSPSAATTTAADLVQSELDRVRDSATAIENELHNTLLKERSRSQQLERQIERKNLEVDLLNQQLNNLQQEMMMRVAELQTQIETFKERERTMEMDAKNELEARVLKAANENNAFYEASIKSAKVQHQRELSCLREELVTERKRHSAALEKEVNLRNRAENQENALKVELNALQDKLNTLQIEYAQKRDMHTSEAKGWERERKKIEAEYQTRITVIEKERDQIHSHAQQELHQKTQELSHKYQVSLAAMQKATAETLKQEYEGDLIRQNQELAKKCQHEIELVRTEERKLAALELNNLRAAFMKREHSTSEDLIQLEKLHTQRVNQLEQQIHNLKTNNDRLVEEVRVMSQQVDKGSEASQAKALQYREAMEKHARRAELLTLQLSNLQTELQQSQGREANYRTQLSKALEDLRVKAAELIAAKQQVSLNTAQAQQWKKVSQESDLSISAAETNLQIARDEVSMLEFEIKRLKEENSALKMELIRADKLIYGIPQHQPDPRSYVVEMENHPVNQIAGQSYPLNKSLNMSVATGAAVSGIAAGYQTPRVSKKSSTTSSAVKKPKIVTPVVASYTPSTLLNTSTRSFTSTHRGSF